MTAHFSEPHMPRATPFDNGPADAILATVEAHWHDMRRGRVAPDRADIDPRALDAALPWSFVLQRTAPGATRLRVAGQKLHDMIKMDPRGMPIATLFHSASHQRLSDWIETAFNAPALVELDLTSPGGLTRSAMRGRLLLLPLRNGVGETYRLFGAIVSDGHIGLRQRLFSVEGTLPARIMHLDHNAMTSPIRRVAPVIDRKPVPLGPQDISVFLPRSDVPQSDLPQSDLPQTKPAYASDVAKKGSHLRLVVNNT